MLLRAGILCAGLLGGAVLVAGCDGRSVAANDSGHALPDAGDAGGGGDVAELRDSRADVETVTCGDGVRGGGEVCDGADLGGVTCASLPGFVSGALACLGDCSGYDTAACVPMGPGCGNQVIDPGEVCDGVDLDGLGCTDFGYASGDLWCAGDCGGYLFHGCRWSSPYLCGDGVLNGGEWCEGNQFEDDCEYFGFTGGTLSCTPGCHYDFSTCLGDACALLGLYGDGESCDPCQLMGGTEDPDCAQLCGVVDNWCRAGVFWELGVEACALTTGQSDPDCGLCGDGAVGPLEDCDGANLGPGTPVTCQDLGFAGGTLACDANCRYDTAGCIP